MKTNEYKSEIDRLTRDTQETKRKYFEIKKREQLAREQFENTVDSLILMTGIAKSDANANQPSR